MADAAVDLRPPKAMLDDLAVYTVQSSDLIAKIVKEMPQVAPAPGIPSFTKQLAKVVGADSSGVLQIINAWVNLHYVVEHSAVTVDDLLSAITKAVEVADWPWNPELIAKWKALLPQTKEGLLRMTDDSSVMTSAKFSNLAYNRQNVLHGTKIISDIRPVFNEAATKIEGMIVTHSLVIRFSDGTAKAPKELHLTLDWTDINTLREECDRADLKAECILKAMRGQKWDTVLFPRDEEEPS